MEFASKTGIELVQGAHLSEEMLIVTDVMLEKE